MEQRTGDPLSASGLAAQAAQQPGTAIAAPHQVGEAAREVAMIRMAFEAAAVMPRNELQAADRLMAACRRPRFAEKAEYRFPRSGADVVGATVELAREAARCWGHALYGYSIIGEDDESIHLQAWAWDCQTGARDHAEARFKKKIQRKRGGETVWVTPDERDLDELIARRAAKLVRNCLLHVLPTDLIDEAMEQAHATMAGEAHTAINSGDAERDEFLGKLLKFALGIGLTRGQLNAWVGGPFAGIQPEQVAALKGILRSVRDGNSKASEHFPSVEDAANGVAAPTATDPAETQPKAQPQAQVVEAPAADPQEPAQAGPRSLADLAQQAGQRQPLLPEDTTEAAPVADDDTPF